jgi:hypothetical protein
MEEESRGRPVKDAGGDSPSSTSSKNGQQGVPPAPDNPDSTPPMKNSRKKKATSKVKSFAKSIASAPRQLAQSIVTNNPLIATTSANKKSELSTLAETERAESSASGYDEEADEDDSINSDTLEGHLQEQTSAPVIRLPTANPRDPRLSAVMELSMEWSSSCLSSDDEFENDEEDEYKDRDASSDDTKITSNGARTSRANRLASKMGKVAVKMAKAPLNLTKRLGTVGEDDDSQLQADPLTSSSQNSTVSSILTAPGMIASKMKDAAVGISKMPKNIVNGMKQGTSLTSPSRPIVSTEELSPKLKKDTSFVITTSRPPLSVSASKNEKSLKSFLLSDAANATSSRSGLLSEHNSQSTASFLSTSIRNHSLSGSEGASIATFATFETSPSLRSKRSVFSNSAGSMPSLASILHQDSVLDLGVSSMNLDISSRSKRSVFSSMGSMPSLASILHQDSVLDIGISSLSLDISSRSKRSVFSSMGSMPSLASIANQDSVLDIGISSLSLDCASPSQRSKRSAAMNSMGSMPSLASISHRGFDSPSGRSKRTVMFSDPENMTGLASASQAESTVNLENSFGSMSTSRSTSEPQEGGGAAYFMHGLPLIQDNCAGTTLEDLAPAADILLNQKKADKQQQRWSSRDDRMLLAQGVRILPSYSSRYINTDKAPNDNESNDDQTTLDSAPRVASRRTSVEIAPLDMSTLSEIASPLHVPQRRASGNETIPLWSLGQMDSAPIVARRRSSGQGYAQPRVSSRNSYTESTANSSMADAAAVVAALDESSQKDSKPRATRRRSSSQNVIPLPTLLEDDHHAGDGSQTKSSMAAAAAEVAASFEEDVMPHVALRRASVQDTNPMTPVLENDDDDVADSRPSVSDTMPLPARRRTSDILIGSKSC